MLMITAWSWGAYLGDKLIRVMTSSFQRPNPKGFKIHAKISGHYVNSIMACQEAKDNGYDEALSLPTEQAARIALRTQQIVAFESGAAETVDPLAGSFFVESLTAEVENKSWELIEKIDLLGGSVAAIEEEFMQNEIAASAYEYQKNIENGSKISVGVNKFTNDEKMDTPVFKIDGSIQIIQTEKLQKLRAKRDNKKSTDCLLALSAAAKGTENIMPLVVDAVEHYCTLGEIADCLREVFGEYK